MGKIVLFLVLDIIAIALLVHSVLLAVDSKETIMAFMTGGAFVWVMERQWKQWQKLYQAWKR